MTEADRQLVDLLLEDDLAEAERASLLARLENDPSAVAYLAERALLHVELRQSLQRRASQQWALATAAPGAPARKIAPFWRPSFAALAAAAVILLAACGAWWWQTMHHATGCGAEITEVGGS